MVRGLKYKKIDLHLHTPASPCFQDISLKGLPEREQSKRFIDRIVECGLEIIAITDHNTGKWIDIIKETASTYEFPEGYNLTIIPGVEITSHNQIHIIALFDIDKDSNFITSFLGNIGIDSDMQAKHETKSDETEESILKAIKDKGGLAVLAHVNKARGALEQLDGQTRLQLVNSCMYDAIESADGTIPDFFTDGNNYKSQKPIACYISTDNPMDNSCNHSLSGIGGKYSYFKLDNKELSSPHSLVQVQS